MESMEKMDDSMEMNETAAMAEETEKIEEPEKKETPAGTETTEKSTKTAKAARRPRWEILQSRDEIRSKGKYAQEKMMNGMIMEGDIRRVEKYLESAGNQRGGKMSTNPFRQQLYTTIVGIAVAARAALDGGLGEEEAFTLSDSYMQEADTCTSPEQLWDIYRRAVLDFTERVHENKSDVLMSEKIKLSIDYILKHLHYDISLKQIADNAGLSETYFSALFKKETGETVSEFIQKSRVKEAQSMIQYSEYSLLEIGQYLGFCSQSHFSKTFRRYTGMTPGQYRKKNFKRTW
ncbi:MAG: AraC family transcriptional regulator [Lachnospiraceae bacterium]|nr:AraC family transcriptional regulator [Lachnospiraceae bacterium]